MMQYLSNPFALAIAGAVVCAVIWLIWGRDNQPVDRFLQVKIKGGKTAENISESIKSKKILSLFVDSSTGRWFNKVIISSEIEQDIIKLWRSMGLEFNVFGAKEVLINRYEVKDDAGNTEVKYRPIQTLLSSTQTTPTELYAVVMQKWIKVALPLTVPKSTMQKLMPILIWTAALLFMAFAMSQS